MSDLFDFFFNGKDVFTSKKPDEKPQENKTKIIIPIQDGVTTSKADAGKGTTKVVPTSNQTAIAGGTEKKTEAVSETSKPKKTESKAIKSGTNSKNGVSAPKSANVTKAVSKEAEPEKKADENVSKGTIGPESKEEAEKATVQTENANVAEPEKPKPKRKVACISKVGSDHTFSNKNNHDFAMNFLNMKIVMDGCGSGKHSEIGTGIFGQLFARKAKDYYKNGLAIDEKNIVQVIDDVFINMLKLCNDTKFIFENYCFTILICFEFEDEFVVYSCGDGYIIKENKDGISFDVLDDGEYPCYYVYNFIQDKSALKEYKDGVSFKVTRFPKAEYVNVGVATDGLRFYENILVVEKNKLMEYLRDGKGPQIEKLVNRCNMKSNGVFHDDISICF